MTIKEIANSLGVSTATVSNVIHGHLEKMSPETAQLIRKKLEQYQYIPNMGARMLAKGDSEIVGVITNYPNREEKLALADPFVSEMIAALENAIRGRGYYTMLRGRSDGGGDPPHFADVERRRADRNGPAGQSVPGADAGDTQAYRICGLLLRSGGTIQ